MDEEMEVKTPKPAAKRDKTLDFLIAQIVICALALVFVLAVKVIGGEVYQYSRAVFEENFDQSINMQQVLSANEARKIIAVQATAYGMGGEADEDVDFIENEHEISDDVNEQLSTAQVNTMHLPVEGTVTCEFGYRIHPISGKYSFHTGIDIGADEGTDIYAALDGTVTQVVYDDYGYGNYFIITHTDGVKTMYAHCSSIDVKEGDVVKKGDVTAHVGSTGLSTGPHLHFEVRVNDIRLNPRWFIEL